MVQLQPMQMAVHAAGAAIFGYALYYDLVHVHLPNHLKGNVAFAAMTAFPGKWKFLTIWNIVLQLVYHCLALANDFIGSSELNAKRQSFLQKCRDGLFASWAFPTGVFVSLSFWTLYSIDRALVFPKELDAFYPNWLNHAVHTAPILLLTTEFYTVPKLFPVRSLAVVGNLCFSGTYSTWAFDINSIVFVSSAFWSIYVMDRELVFPAIIDRIFPTWLNHALHTAPIVFVTFETMTVPRIYPKTVVGASILLGGIVWYMSWLVWVYYYSGVWAYPVLEILNNMQRGVFMGSSALLILAFYFFGESLNKWRWGSETKAGPGKGTKAGAKAKRKTK